MSRLERRALSLSALVSSGLGLVLALPLLASCEVAPDGLISSVVDPEVNEARAAMRGFSWVIDHQVAGMPRPGGTRPLDEDLQYLRDQGVDLLVSLTETPVDPEALSRHGIEGLHIPVRDFHAPTQAQLDQYVNAVRSGVNESRQVGTHCAGGLGRTGTFVAALFVSRGMAAEAAIAEVRRLRPGSIETDEQEQAVREFAARQK